MDYLLAFPSVAIVGTYSTMFFVFGCVAFVLALPYILAIVKEKYTLSPDSEKMEITY